MRRSPFAAGMLRCMRLSPSDLKENPVSYAWKNKNEKRCNFGLCHLFFYTSGLRSCQAHSHNHEWITTELFFEPAVTCHAIGISPPIPWFRRSGLRFANVVKSRDGSAIEMLGVEACNTSGPNMTPRRTATRFTSVKLRNFPRMSLPGKDPFLLVFITANCKERVLGPRLISFLVGEQKKTTLHFRAHFDRKKPSPPGGFPICYVPALRTVRRGPPWRMCTSNLVLQSAVRQSRIVSNIQVLTFSVLIVDLNSQSMRSTSQCTVPRDLWKYRSYEIWTFESRTVLG